MVSCYSYPSTTCFFLLPLFWDLATLMLIYLITFWKLENSMYEHTTIYLSILLLMTILVVSKYLLSQTMRLQWIIFFSGSSFMYMGFSKNIYLGVQPLSCRALASSNRSNLCISYIHTRYRECPNAPHSWQLLVSKFMNIWLGACHCSALTFQWFLS